jgi:Putative zinc-finger
MSTHPLTDLSDYLDGDLDAAARAAIDAHLAGCAECRAAVADLTALRRAATAWRDADAAPAPDLWPGIAARLTGPREVAPGASGAPLRAVPRLAWYQRRWSVGVPELAVAAALVAAVSGALLWPRATPPAPAAAGPVAVTAEADAFDGDAGEVVPVNFADAQYDAAVVDLERVLLEQRERLDPRTVIVLERNLRIIDDAIREARQALATDPANTLLNAHLAGARQRKLDLLRRAAQITEGD